MRNKVKITSSYKVELVQMTNKIIKTFNLYLSSAD